jgi:predicted dehydrogenase
MSKFNRREFLAKSTVAAGAVALGGATVSMVAAGEAGPKPVRIGVVGTGRRGRNHLHSLLANNKGLTVPAICDAKPAALAEGAAIVKHLGGTAPETYGKDDLDYRNLLARDDIDGVLVATDVQWLAPISIDALKADKCVGSEVSGTHSLDECWELVKAKEKSRGHYMLLENCCYGRETLMLYNMVRQGVFGETYFGVGSYIHDCRFLYFDPKGELTWRGRLVRDNYGCNYPSHAMGSTCKWLGINDGDRLVSCSAVMTKPLGLHEYAVKTYGPDSPQAKIDFKSGDITTTTIRTANGKIIRIECGLSSTRPYSRYYELQGANGCYDSRTGIYIREGATSPDVWTDKLLAKYADKFEHPYYRADGDTATKAGGHGGIDYFVIREFVKMVREKKEPWIDAYDAAAWTSIMHCSHASLDRGGAHVEIPDFTGGRWNDPNWRKDRMV